MSEHTDLIQVAVILFTTGAAVAGVYIWLLIRAIGRPRRERGDAWAKEHPRRRGK